MRVDVCRATRVDATQPAVTAERRELCLDRRGRRRRRARRRAPADPARRRREGGRRDRRARRPRRVRGDARASRGSRRCRRIRRARRRSADSSARSRTRSPRSSCAPAPSSPRVDALVTRARATGYPPLARRRPRADARFSRWRAIAGRTPPATPRSSSSRQRPPARTTCASTVRQSRLDYGASLQRFDDAAQRGHVAEGLLERLGDDPGAPRPSSTAPWPTPWAQGKFEPALTLANMCVAEHERVVPRDEGHIGTALQRAAVLEHALNCIDEALVPRSARSSFNPPSAAPPSCRAVINPRGAMRKTWATRTAEALYRRAISIWKRRAARRGRQQRVPEPANLLQNQGRHAEAILLYRRRLAILERTWVARTTVSRRRSTCLEALTADRRLEQGEAAARRSLAIRETNGHASLPSEAIAHANFAKQYLCAATCRARSRSTRPRLRSASRFTARTIRCSLAACSRSPRSTSSQSGRTWRGRGSSARGRYLDAPEAEIVRARLQFALAQVLWPRPAERATARAFADAALAAFRADEDAEHIAAVETWRRANGVDVTDDTTHGSIPLDGGEPAAGRS